MPSGWELVEARPVFDMVGEGRPGHGVLGLSDPDVHHLDGRWVMFLGAFTTRFSVRIVEARLPLGASLDDDRWELVTDGRGRAATLGPPKRRRAWDAYGMHTPSYVAARVAGREVKRIYYAGRMSRAGTGPRSRFAIGFLERGGDGWHRQSGPIITGDADRPSALEPVVVFTSGRWRMWYLSAIGEVGRGEQPDYELRYTESDDGEAWTEPERFASTDEGWFDNSVAPSGTGWTMLLARGTNLHGTKPFPSQGLWLSECDAEPGRRAMWTPPQRLLDTDVGTERWYAAGVCGPAVVPDGGMLHVFATGTWSQTPWRHLALECLRERRRPPVPAPFYLTTGRFTFRPTDK